ncbi:high-affinity nickel-transport protein-domain-containing protein [Xylariaceae sp. FL0016]|nr:high-affinity nickel-transport protein-domain-containing protein [Xylariaceae sp. FL0016]
MPHVTLPQRLQSLPLPALNIIALLVLVNLVTWAAVSYPLAHHPNLISPAVLSYTLGLRHALDADHISAIDLMTRRLIASGQRPVSVGTFFSLGHSTIVVVTCVVVAATSGALRQRFGRFQYVGGIVGTSVSAAFLVILCAGNAWVLHRLVRRLRAALRAAPPPSHPHPHRHRAHDDDDDDDRPGPGPGGNDAAVVEPEGDQDHDHAAARDLQLEGPGFLAHVFRRLFRVVDRPWKMYPLGVLFGLGFDTSSEIAVLGVASLQGAQGTSLWLILIFPALFTATPSAPKRGFTLENGKEKEGEGNKTTTAKLC